MENSLLQFEKDVFKIRQLDENEAFLYKSMRLEAIQSEPAMFRCSTPAEADLSDADWIERIKFPRAIFGLFENDTPIGMTSILKLNDEEAYLGQSYIKKEYRGFPVFYIKSGWNGLQDII